MTARHRLCWLAAILVALALPVAAQRTPEQRYFDWTDLPFPAAEYAARRTTLAAALRASGGGVFLSPAATGATDGATFRQLDTFWYLTGLEVPDAVVVIDSDDGRTTLYAPPRDARFENPARRNDFPGRPLQADPDLAAQTGLAAVRPMAQFETDLAGWVARGRTLRVDPGGLGAVTADEPGLIPPMAPLGHFAAWLARRHPTAQLSSAYRDVALTRGIVLRAPPRAVLGRSVGGRRPAGARDGHHRRAVYYNHDRGISVFTEDDVLITSTGRENLTGHVARTPSALEALMRVSGR